jgi:hypothetical protein
MFRGLEVREAKAVVAKWKRLWSEPGVSTGAADRPAGEEHELDERD